MPVSGVRSWTHRLYYFGDLQPRHRSCRELVTVPFNVEDLDPVEVSDNFEVSIEIGETTSVEIVANEELVDELDIRVHNGELTIGIKNGVPVRNA